MRSIVGLGKKVLRLWMRQVIALLPRTQRFKLIRSYVDCDPAPSDRLILKIAETQQELEDCFRLLHDAYVDAGLMKPDVSGLRVTIYHALPTTTTLCAKFDGRVVGTLSLIRESALGVPLQRIFDLTQIREKEGQITEVSALAIHKDFRVTGGSILFPLMKFMYEYCTTFFDTRHLVIAVNPRHIEMYESLLFFKRLSANIVEKYDFVNGAPAVGATIDLREAPRIFKHHYASKPLRKNLYAYFMKVRMPNICFPNRRFYTTNDPVLTPELLDYFFNVRTNTFSNLSERVKKLLHSIYDLPEYKSKLPQVVSEDNLVPIRRSQRFSVKCPALVSFSDKNVEEKILVEVVDVSEDGFQAKVSGNSMPLDTYFDATIRLGRKDTSHLRAFAVRRYESGGRFIYGFSLKKTDAIWVKFIAALCGSMTYGELDHPTRFVP